MSAIGSNNTAAATRARARTLLVFLSSTGNFAMSRQSGDELLRSGFGDIVWVPWPGRVADAA